MAEPSLVARLELGSHELVSLVGGGGKTTLLFALGSTLTGRVVLTTTTKMDASDTRGVAVLLRPDDPALDAGLAAEPVVLVWDAAVAEKAVGVSPDVADAWFDRVDHVVVEADGSRRRPFKAPGLHEPVIPSRSTMVCVVMGAGALGEIINDCCHRPDRVAALARCGLDDVLTPERAARVICHPDGGLRGVPDQARTALVITAVTEANRRSVEHTARLCDQTFDHSVLVARSRPGGTPRVL